MSDFQITDCQVRRKYKGKVFFFEKLIIYTESKEGRLEYSGHFDCLDVGIVYSNKITKFKLCCKGTMTEAINLHSDPNTIVEWLTLLEQVMTENLKRGEWCQYRLH